MKLLKITSAKKRFKVSKTIKLNMNPIDLGTPKARMMSAQSRKEGR